MHALVVLAVIVAVAAAVRGTWSPCGLSMLSTITPVSERSRGHRYTGTAAWFVVGAAVGGACLGGAAAVGAAIVRMSSVGPTPLLASAGAAAAIGVASDLRIFGLSLPLHPRQVDETWLNKYRTWVYGGGFGWQVGCGFATYIMSAAVYLTAVLAVLTERPAAAFGVCVLFGLVRGVAVLLTARVTSIDALSALHRRLERLEPASRGVAIAIQAGVAAAALALAGSTPAGLSVAIGAASALLAAGALVAAPRRGSHAFEM